MFMLRSNITIAR